MDQIKKIPYKWLATLVVVIGIFMVNLSTSIVNLSVTKMMQDFNVSLDQIQWVVSVYTLTLGAVIPSTGYLSERFGLKKTFVVALGLFTAGSALCGIAWNEMAVIAFRIVQGLGGACIISLGMTILMTSFDKKEMGMVTGVIGVCVMAAPALGPTLGGYIIENLDWRFVFFINVPVGVIGTFLAMLILRETETKTSSRLDIVGLVTSAAGMTCLLYVLGKSDVDWGDFSNVMLLMIGCFSLLIFVVNELMISEPLLNLRLLKDYTFCMSNIIMNIATLALYGGVFLMPIFLQQLKGLSPMQAGLILFPEAIATAVSMMLYGKFANKLDTRIFAITALLLIGVNSYNMTQITLETSDLTITMLLLIRGFGVGFLTGPVQAIGFSTLPKSAMANASALMNTVKQVGASIGLTIITTIMQHQAAIHYGDLSQQVNSFNPSSVNLYKQIQGLLMQNGASSLDAQSGALSLIFGTVAKQAQLLAMNDTMMVICFFTFVIILPTLFLKVKKQGEAL